MDQNEVTGYNDACSNFLYLLRDDMNCIQFMRSLELVYGMLVIYTD